MKDVLDYVVVGGGISGLSAAFEFEQNSLSGVVLEEQDKTGGCIESVCVDNFHQELGAHSVFNSYGGLLQIIQSLSLQDKIIPKRKMPFLLWNQYKLSSIFKALDLPLLMRSVFGLFWYKKSNKTIAQFYSTITGEENYTEVVRHALNAVACQDMDVAPANFLFQKRGRNKKFIRKFSFDKGLQTFIAALDGSLNVKHNTKVTSIDLIDDAYIVNTDQGEFYCRSLLLATPVAVTTALVKNINPDAFSRLNQIRSTRFSSVAVMVDKDKVNTDKCTGWIGVDSDFYSMVSADPTNTDDKYRGFTFHFKPYIGNRPELADKIGQILNIDFKDIANINYKINVLPVIGQQHYKLVAEIDKSLKNKSLGITGNYFYGMSLEDCVQRSLAETNRLTKLVS